MKNLSDRVAVVTGAGSGIGRALAVQLAEAGCKLALSDINEQGLAETVSLAEQAGAEVFSEKLDVADRDAVYAHADKVKAHFGKVNLVFNNAGVAVGATVEDTSYEDFEWLMGINFWLSLIHI